MKVLSRSEWTVLICLFVFSFIPSFGGLVRVVELAGGPSIMPHNPRASADPASIVIHLLTSFVFCIVGAVQFLPSVRRHYPATHRAMGRIIVVMGCLSAASGLWMTHVYTFAPELQGRVLYWVRMGVGGAMIVFLVRAVMTIRSRKVAQHGASMLRAYALAQGAATQTVLGIVWMICVGSEAMGPVRDAMMVFAWLLNIWVAEVLIRRMFRRNRVALGQVAKQ